MYHRTIKIHIENWRHNCVPHIHDHYPPLLHLSSLKQLLSQHHQDLDIKITYNEALNEIEYHNNNEQIQMPPHINDYRACDTYTNIMFDFSSNLPCRSNAHCHDNLLTIIYDIDPSSCNNDCFKFYNLNVCIKSDHINNIKISDIILNNASLNIITDNVNKVVIDKVTFTDYHYNESLLQIAIHNNSHIGSYIFSAETIQWTQFSLNSFGVKKPNLININIDYIIHCIHRYDFPNHIYHPLFVKLGKCLNVICYQYDYWCLQQECNSPLAGPKLFNEVKSYYFSVTGVNKILLDGAQDNIATLPFDVWNVIADYFHPCFGNQIKNTIHEIHARLTPLGDDNNTEVIDALSDL